MRPIDLARQELGFDKGEVFLDHVIWSYTGFPCFWNTRPGETAEDCFRRELREVREYLDAHGKMPPHPLDEYERHLMENK
jgi:hypothetical protein